MNSTFAFNNNNNHNNTISQNNQYDEFYYYDMRNEEEFYGDDTPLFFHGSPNAVSHFPVSLISSKRRRSVSFDQTIYVTETLSLDDYTPDEIDACWYSSSEYDEIREDALYDMECNDGSSSSLGTQFQHHRKNSLEAVLAEQERQWLLEYENDDYLGEIYHDTSAECQKHAIEKAKHDAAIAKAYCMDQLQLQLPQKLNGCQFFIDLTKFFPWKSKETLLMDPNEF